MDIPPLWPVDRAGVVTRLRLVPAAAAQMALAVPALVLAVLTIVGWATSPVLVGLAILAGAVPATGLVTDAYRSLAGRLLGEEIVADHEPTAGQPPLSVVVTWLRDPARWRELGHLAFSATGGFVMSGIDGAPARRRRDVPHHAALARLAVAVPAGAGPRVAGGLVDGRGARARGPGSRGPDAARPQRGRGASRARLRGDPLARRDGRPLGRRAAPPRARPARRAAGQTGVGGHVPRAGGAPDATRPRGGGQAAGRGPPGDGRRARRPALGGSRHPPARARRPRAARGRRGDRPAAGDPRDRRGGRAGPAAGAGGVRGVLRHCRVPRQRRQALGCHPRHGLARPRRVAPAGPGPRRRPWRRVRGRGRRAGRGGPAAAGLRRFNGARQPGRGSDDGEDGGPCASSSPRTTPSSARD